MFKGEPGTRKSSSALSFPKPIYFFDWDGKMDALVIPMRKWGIDPKQIEFDTYKDWDSAKAKLEKLQVKCPYRTIVIDSVTSCADGINRQSLKFKIGEGKSNKAGGIPVNSIDEYNAEESALKELVALTKDIRAYHKVNIILIAHVIQKEQRNPAGQITHISRQIVTAGKGIAQKIPAYCSEVYHFNIKKGFDPTQGGEYSLLTVHTGDDFARSSLPLDTEIVFKDQPLYDNWIKPAIDKMNNQPPQTYTKL